MERVKKYFELNNEPVFHTIDDETAKDLNIDELFDKLNHTTSVIGEQYLYNLLRKIPNYSPVEKHEKWISRSSQDKQLQKQTSKLLSKLEKSEGYYIYPLITKAKTVFSKKVIFLFRILQLLPAVFIALYILNANYIFFLGIVIAFLVNLAIHFYSKQISFLHAGTIPQLYRLIFIAEKLLSIPQIKELNLLDHKTLTDLKDLKSHLSVFRFNVKFESEFSGIVFLITELIRAFFLTEPINLNKIFDEVNKRQSELFNVFQFVGLVDTLLSINKLRQYLNNYCLPEITCEKDTLITEDVYHPLIDDCVKNSIQSESAESFLILGSNMSGKTTFIRTIGINVLLAQTINTCFAKKLILNRQKIYSSITIKDDLLDGKSYYLSEVLRIKEIVKETESGHNLILFDELFKGTNTVERIAGAKAVLNYITSNLHNKIFVATHDIELVDLLKSKMTPVYFTESVENNELTFDYLLRYESPRQRNAIRILSIFDYPVEIVEDALKTTESFHKIQN